MLAKFANKFVSKQSEFWLRSTEIKDRSGSRTLWPRSQMSYLTDPILRLRKKQVEMIGSEIQSERKKINLPQWSRHLLSYGLILLREINPPELSSSLTQDRWINKLSIFPILILRIMRWSIYRKYSDLFSFAWWFFDPWFRPTLYEDVLRPAIQTYIHKYHIRTFQRSYNSIQIIK